MNIRKEKAAIPVGNQLATPAATFTASSVSPATLARTPIVDTIASFAVKPEIEAATGCHSPNPSGAKSAIYKGEEVVDQLEIVDARSEDPDDCLKVQLWKYNPSYFAKEGCVDLVSLVCTFRGNEDERIEMSIEKLLEEL